MDKAVTKLEIKMVFINEIAKQYKEHNEIVPPWLSIGDIDFDIDFDKNSED